MLEMALAFNYSQKDGSGNKPTQWVEPRCGKARGVSEGLPQEGRRGRRRDPLDPHIETWQKKDQTTGFKLVGKVLDWNSPAVVATHRRVAGGDDKPAGVHGGGQSRRPASSAISTTSAGRRALLMVTRSPIQPPLRPVAPARQLSFEQVREMRELHERRGKAIPSWRPSSLR